MRGSLGSIMFATTVAGALLQGAGAFAHHSFAAVYDQNDPVSVTGTVTKVLWANPHAVVYVDAKGTDGAVVSWQFELHSPNSMMRGGWKRDSVKPGDVVTVKGSRARGGANRAFVYVAVFPDGREVFKIKFEAE